MKLNFLKLNKSSAPAVSSLRKKLYDTDRFWFLGLGVFFSIFVVTALVGFKLFYSVYFETYKNEISTEEKKDPINIDSLKAAIKRRSDFQNATTTLPSDPSL